MCNYRAPTQRSLQNSQCTETLVHGKTGPLMKDHFSLQITAEEIFQRKVWSGQRAVKSAVQEHKLLGPVPFCRKEERLIPQFWPVLLIIFAFLSLLQLRGMHFYPLHPGNVVWPISAADYSVIWGVLLRLAGAVLSSKSPAQSTCEPLQHGCTLTFMTNFDMHTCKLQYSHTEGSEKRIFCTWDRLCYHKAKEWTFQKNLKLDLRIATELETITLLLPNHVWLRKKLLPKSNQPPFVLHLKVYLTAK